MDQSSLSDLLRRLNVLMRKLEADGSYVGADTVSMAIDAIKLLSPNAKPEDPK